jgi:hypothetical protein
MNDSSMPETIAGMISGNVAGPLSVQSVFPLACERRLYFLFGPSLVDGPGGGKWQKVGKRPQSPRPAEWLRPSGKMMSRYPRNGHRQTAAACHKRAKSGHSKQRKLRHLKLRHLKCALPAVNQFAQLRGNDATTLQLCAARLPTVWRADAVRLAETLVDHLRGSIPWACATLQEFSA